MKLKKIKKNIAKLPLNKQLKLSNWMDQLLKDPQNIEKNRVSTETMVDHS